MRRGPPQDLLSLVAAARADVAQRETERKAAWNPPPAQQLPCFQWECQWAPHNYHMAFGRWQQACAELRHLERQLAARQANREDPADVRV